MAAWIGRRYGVTVDPERHLLPANGSKEALYNLAPLLLDDPPPAPGRELIAIPELAYQVYGDSALLHHAEVAARCPWTADWLPDLNAITPAVGAAPASCCGSTSPTTPPGRWPP